MPLLNVVVDISHHNTVTSFQEAKNSGILGVIHKATEGLQFVDANYDGRRVLATSVGLFWGLIILASVVIQKGKLIIF